MSKLTRSFINYHINCEEALKIVLNHSSDSIQAAEDLQTNVALMKIELYSPKLKDKKTALAIIRKFQPYLKVDKKEVKIVKKESTIVQLEKGIEILDRCESIGESINNRLQKETDSLLKKYDKPFDEVGRGSRILNWWMNFF